MESDEAVERHAARVAGAVMWALEDHGVLLDSNAAALVHDAVAVEVRAEIASKAAAERVVNAAWDAGLAPDDDDR